MLDHLEHTFGQTVIFSEDFYWTPLQGDFDGSKVPRMSLGSVFDELEFLQPSICEEDGELYEPILDEVKWLGGAFQCLGLTGSLLQGMSEESRCSGELRLFRGEWEAPATTGGPRKEKVIRPNAISIGELRMLASRLLNFLDSCYGETIELPGERYWVAGDTMFDLYADPKPELLSILTEFETLSAAMISGAEVRWKEHQIFGRVLHGIGCSESWKVENDE